MSPGRASSRTSRSLATPRPGGADLAGPGKAEIFRAIRPGARRCRGQRQWLRTGLALIESQPWYANRQAHYAGILRRLAAHMDWHDRTTRPGHENIAAAVGVSADTVGRAIAWFQQCGLLGLVSPGTTPLLRAHVLHGHEGNLAAIYVCTVPHRRRRPLLHAGAGQGEFADLTTPRSGGVKAPHAHDAPTTNPIKARATRGQPLLPRPGTGPLNRCPKTRIEGLGAAQAIQDRSEWLRCLSAEHVRHLARAYFAAGWTPADVLHAFDHDPSGRQYGYSAGVRHPAGWAAARLGRWLGPAGEPLPSRSQILARNRSRIRAEQEARRRQERETERHAADATKSGRLAAAARETLAAASDQARTAMARHRARQRAAAASQAESPPSEPSAAMPADVGGMREAILARLDAAALLRAQRHRAATAQRIAGPAAARAVAGETSRTVASAQLAEARVDPVRGISPSAQEEAAGEQ